MAKVLILGGGFAGVVAAESLARRVGGDHDITLVSRSDRFIFYPALVRLAFKRASVNDIVFDLREAMLDRRVRFVEGEVARIHPTEHLVTFSRGDVVGEMPYDYLLIALGRRLKTELVTGFFEHANHILSVRDANRFAYAVERFHSGRAVIGHCVGARLPIPVFETAFALARNIRAEGNTDGCHISVVTDESLDAMFGGVPISRKLNEALESHQIELIENFQIQQVSSGEVISKEEKALKYDMNMLVPPFGGPAALIGTGLTDREGYLEVDSMMRVGTSEGVYAAGDCVALPGPKTGHMAVRQAEVAAENLAAEIERHNPTVTYDHEMMLVLDAGDDSIFVQKDLSGEKDASVRVSRFWSWAKRGHEQYWTMRHS